MTDWSRSTYLDLTSWNALKYDAGTTVEEAYDIEPGDVVAAGKDDAIVVGFVLPRLTDPTELLSGSWGERQEALAELNEKDALWSTFGADAALFKETVAAIEAAGGEVDDSALPQPGTRTIWASLDSDAFEALLGQKLFGVKDEDGAISAPFWNGTLDPGALPIEGLVVQRPMEAAEDDLSGGRSVELEQGFQGIGNGTSDAARGSAFANALATFYEFPLTDTSTVATTVALIAPEIGDALPGGADYQTALNAYLAAVGLSGAASVYAVRPEGAESEYNAGLAAERGLDTGVVSVINPHATIGFYDGSTVFGSLQLAIYDATRDPSVLSNSFSDIARPAPDSPFAQAWEQLYVDGALSNLAIFSASGDGGSNNHVANGLPNIDLTVSSPFTTVVGGTSISTLGQAQDDPTLQAVVEAVKAEDRGVLWALIAGGLTIAPKDTVEATYLIETVWNQYTLNGKQITGLLDNVAGSGGVDQRQEVPDFQSGFGLTPSVAGSSDETGRGVPDVSALAGGNFFYNVPNGDLTQTVLSGGTSASSPLWAALFQQIGTIFAAQGLPNLGYANDLLYQAAVITPAAFRDVRVGDNRSSFAEGDDDSHYEMTVGQGEDAQTGPVNVTGYGYDAGEGFDLATGLGTPNGRILTDTLLSIAHKELYFDTPAVLEETEDGEWAAAADQVVSVQVSSAEATRGALRIGGEKVGFETEASERFAWTSRLAEQSLDKNLSADLIKMFDGAAQGETFQIALDACDTLAVKVGGAAASAVQGALSSEFGFVDFFADDATVRVARNVAVAETENGRDDMNFTVDMRQLVGAEVKFQVYEVDDFAGRIDGVAPGEKGYGALARANAYATTDGATKVTAPGFGEFASHEFTGADAGDLIAMRVFTHGKTYYGFAEGNETVDGEKVSHLWNYGANTWGFETAYGGGDRDYNDLIVGFDFIDYTDDLIA